MTLNDEVQAAVDRMVRRAVSRFLGGDSNRECACCGKMFEAKNSRNMFCRALCRIKFYRGRFFPKKKGKITLKKAA